MIKSLGENETKRERERERERERDYFSQTNKQQYQLVVH